MSDPDAGTAAVQTTLSVQHGILTLATTANLGSFTGNGTASVTITGRLTAINTALDGLLYTPAAGFAGTDS